MAHLYNSRSQGKPCVERGREKLGISSRLRATSQKQPSPGAQVRASRANVRKAPRPTSLRRAPSQRRAQDTTSAIITAAEHLLVQVGYARASTNAIARLAGVSIGSLYQYFDDKEAVYRAVIQRHRDQVLPVVMTALTPMADPERDLIEVTLGLLRQMAQANARNPKLMVAIETELGWLEHESDGEARVIERVRRILLERFPLPTDELTVSAELMVVTVAHLSRWLVHGKPPELDAEMFVAAAGRMLRALLPAPPLATTRRKHPRQR